MKKVLLCVLDGVGCSNEEKGNAFKNANTPNINKFMKEYPNTKINASGTYVGLPEGQIGNSEVGHLTIGAGRIIYQSLELINRSIKDNTFFSNKALLNAIKHAKENNSKLHVLGLLSDGGVHSHIEHIKSVIKLCKNENFSNVYYHFFTDGRDTYNESALNYFKEIEEVINKYNIGTISTISGRFYAMDRDKRYDRVEKAYNAMVLGEGNKIDNIEKYIKESYKKDITDEFIEPAIINENGKIENNDSVIWCNFRPDRAIEILSAITNDDFDGFVKENLNNIYLTTMMYVSDNIKGDICFKREEVDNALGIYLSKLNKKQLRIAETEKYAHVTYFFDGGKDVELPNEKRILIPSPKVATYDMKPEMSAKEITTSLLKEMDENYDFIFLNFANGDMVGHTGKYEETLKAVETIDEMLGKIYDKCISNGYTLMITADHGNCEYMIDEKGNEITSHTNNKVPFIVMDKEVNVKEVDKLSDIAPFVLKYLDLKVPSEMTN